MTRTKNPTPENDFLDDPAVRAGMAWNSFSLYFDLYYPEYREYDTAEFQYEMFSIGEDQNLKLAVVAGFRNSGKSTILSEACAVWSILGKPQKKFVLLLGQTVPKARQALANIRNKLQRTKLLHDDLGPFKQDDTWGLDSIVLPKFGARITAASIEQSIRGFRHNQHRPDLVIADDLEDFESVKTAEGREKPWEWFNREVKPAGNDSVKFIVLGNVLHQDSFIKRLESAIAGGMDGMYRE